VNIWLTVVIAVLAVVFLVIVLTHPGIEKQLWARVYSAGLVVAWIIVMIGRRRQRRQSEHQIND